MWSSESYELTKWKSSEFREYLFLFGPNDFDFNLDLITAAVMVDATASIPTYCKVNATISPSLAIQVDSGRGVERFGRSCRGVCNCPEQWRAYRDLSGGCIVRCRRISGRSASIQLEYTFDGRHSIEGHYHDQILQGDLRKAAAAGDGFDCPAGHGFTQRGASIHAEQEVVVEPGGNGLLNTAS